MLEWALLILEIEDFLPDKLIANPVSFPRYIHCLLPTGLPQDDEFDAQLVQINRQLDTLQTNVSERLTTLQDKLKDLHRAVADMKPKVPEETAEASPAAT